MSSFKTPIKDIELNVITSTQPVEPLLIKSLLTKADTDYQVKKAFLMSLNRGIHNFLAIF